MPEIVFFEVAPYERGMIEAARFAGWDCRYHDGPLNEDTVGLAARASVVSIFIDSKVDEAVLAQTSDLGLVVTRSTGFNHIDVDACERRGIAVANVPTYGESTVAEHAFALLLALARHLPAANRRTHELDFGLSGLMGFDLAGKTFGVVGAGRIGRHALAIARGFGMRTLAYDPAPMPEVAEREGFRYVPLDELLAESDVLSLHAALTPATTHLIDRGALKKMKRTAILINTARGPIVDGGALCEALKEGWIAGAGLDVIEGEELLGEEAELLHRHPTEREARELLYAHALLRSPNVVITPHSAFFTREAVGRLVETSLDAIRAYLAGRPVNLVSRAPGTEVPR